MKITSTEIRELAKDQTSYEKLLYIVNNLNEKIDNESLKIIHSELLVNYINGYYWDKKYVKGEKIIHYSENVEKITGYRIEEIKKQPGRILFFIVEEDSARIKAEMTEFESNPKNNFIILEYRITKRDGNIIWIKEFLAVERDATGKIIKYESFAFDFTQTKDLQLKEQQANEELKKLNTKKDHFISIVSHDLRSPFTSLLGFSEILLNEKNLPKEIQREYLNYIHEASQTQLKMINYLLDWSRLQTGRLIIEPVRLNLKNMINDSVATLIGNAIKKGIDIQINIEEDFFIIADERLMSQSISNLLSNAIKFTPSGKRIYIKGKKFKSGMIEIIVQDEGVGISEKDQQKLFKIEEKLSLEGTDGEKGSGLGLTLVKEIIDKHGGNIWFYSEKEKGSEFHFTVPSAKHSIVIVEDNMDFIRLYKKMNEKYFSDMEVFYTSNGYEAMRVIFQKSPSLLITDHDMPLMNGIQLIEAVREKEIDSNLAILVVSSKLTGEIIEKYKNLNVNNVIEKPIGGEELLMYIKEAIK